MSQSLYNTNLKTVIDEFMLHSFEWGKYDCILFAAASLDTLIGSNYYVEYKNKWNSLQSALKFARDAGLNVEGVVAGIGEKIDWGYEQDGDIVITHDEHATSLSKFSSGVVYGNRMFFMTLSGLCALPMNEIQEPKGIYRCHK